MNGNLKLLTAPDWSEAPEWAQWFAIDEDGEGFWAEHLPTRSHDCWLPMSIKSNYSWAGIFDATDWKNSLQQRPE